MRKLITTLLMTLAVLLGSEGVSESANPAKGYCLLGTEHSHSPIAGKCSATYGKGDCETALREFKPLANKGIANAQFNLGQMYYRGQGVIQDNVYAHMWGNLAAANGNQGGGHLRDIVTKQMTPADISVVQNLALECVRKKYKGC